MYYKCVNCISAASESGFVCVSVGDAPATESPGSGPGGSQHWLGDPLCVYLLQELLPRQPVSTRVPVETRLF